MATEQAEQRRYRGPGVLEVRLPGVGSKGSIVLDGRDISHLVRSVRVSSSVNDLTTVELEMVNVDVLSELESAVVLAHFPDDVREHMERVLRARYKRDLLEDRLLRTDGVEETFEEWLERNAESAGPW